MGNPESPVAVTLAGIALFVTGDASGQKFVTALRNQSVLKFDCAE